METINNDQIRQAVRDSYGAIARTESAGCGCSPSASCGTEPTNSARKVSLAIGYSAQDLSAVPEGANLGLGCGNPIALASLKEGETVVDLGSGAGFDCFLAAQRVGLAGNVIGVDMTPDMISKARKNALNGNYNNVEFRLGEIERLPVADNSVDVIISNCVINLSPAKAEVFDEAFRVLKPGGRLMISDIVLLAQLPDVIKDSVSAYIGCLAGATQKDEYINTIKEAGFREIEVVDETKVVADMWLSDLPESQLIEDIGSSLSAEEIKEAASSVASIKIRAIK